MPIISFRCHTTIHLAPLVNQETIHQDMDRGQQLMSRINQGILREIKPKNPLVEWYYWKDKHTVSDVTEHSLFKMAQGMLSPCLLYTSPSPRDISGSRMPSSA